MTFRPTNPFQALADWHNNACIDNYMQFAQLSACFLESADALVEHCETTHRGVDVHVYAICFLYRHSCELLLKDLLWKSNFALNGNKDFPKDHRLVPLWSILDERTQELFGPDHLLTVAQRNEVKDLFISIEEHDPRSDSFRYPIDNKKNRTHTSLTHVNITALKERIHQVEDYLQTLAYGVSYHYDERSECERQYYGSGF